MHLYLAPYSKVEESFNLQAIHDTLIHGIPTRNAAAFFRSHYDHFTFPGPVPRTFVGAVVMAGLTRPLQIISNMLWSKGLDKFTFQIAGKISDPLVFCVSLSLMDIKKKPEEYLDC